MISTEKVLGIRDIPGARRLYWRTFMGREITEPEISHLLRLCDALWLHSGNPSDPHAELTAGDCSNGFVDVLRALSYTNLCELFAHQLAQKIESVQGELDYYDRMGWGVGSDHAGAAFSYQVAAFLGLRHDFTEKTPKSDPQGQLWKRFIIEPDEEVLQIEELMTTAKTVLQVRGALRRDNPNPVTFAPFVSTFVHRSDVTEIEGTPVVHLVHYDIEKWSPEDCPLCAAGSPRLRPKERNNWAKLTARN